MTDLSAPSEDVLLATARQRAVETLAPLGVFHTMSLPEQEQIYLDVVAQNLADVKRQHGYLEPFATDSGKEMGFAGYDPSFDKSVDNFEDLVDSVDFPDFVGDLLKSVFNANLKVMKEQTDSYIKLMKEATKSTADFIKQIKDDESFARLAESRGDMYNVTVDGDKLALTNPQGDKVDTEDTKVKQHILEAKINMAKEHRAALREVLLMGVTRLVVDKGVVEAGVEFAITANRKSSASHKDQNINVANVQASYDAPLGGLFGGPSGSVNVTNTNIQVNTSNKDASDTMTAKLMGKVNIQFKTDYFKLDNFATMYADGGVKALAPGATPGGGATTAAARP